MAAILMCAPACTTTTQTTPTTAPPNGIAQHEDVVVSVWAVNDGERVEQYNDDDVNPNRYRNSVWDGTAVRIFGGRNEVLAFQVIVEVGPTGINELSAALPILRQRDGAAEIVYRAPSPDPTDYVDRPISLFTEHYMEVSESAHTTASWIIDADGEPDDPYGWKPVQLIPENAARGLGGLPMSVEANANQGLWFEIYTAKDLPAGFYDGEIYIVADTLEVALPLELQVYDFTLPDENSMNAMIFYDEEFLYGEDGFHRSADVEAAYHRFAHRQRVEFVMGYDDRMYVQEAGIRARFDGSAFTPEHGYDGPGVSLGNNIIPRSFYGLPDTYYDSKDAIWADANAWMSSINSTFPHAITFLYMPDEPSSDEDCDFVRETALIVKTNPGIGGTLPLFVTSGYNADIDGVSSAFPAGLIDIWDMNMDLYRQSVARDQRNEGDDCWVYNGMRPYGGAPVYDCPATDMRANIWACFRAEINTYFYWHALYWQYNGRSSEHSNVWADTITYSENDGTMAAGDGVLVFPGEDVFHPEEDRNIAGPCSSIAMANLRRGLQDHQYLTMAREAGLNDLVDSLLDSIVPEVFGDISPVGIHFAERGDSYENARRQLAEALAGRNTTGG